MYAREIFFILCVGKISGIGTSIFGQLVIREILEDESLCHLFRNALSNTNYLTLDCNGDGDKFTAEDITLLPRQRFLVRVLSRPCRISRRIEGLRELMMIGNKTLLNSHLEAMKIERLEHVPYLLRQYESGVLPSMEDILGAIAADLRKASGNDRERVGIWLHVDEHQLFYDDVKQAFKLNEEDTLTNHRAFLSPALDVLSSGWGYNNDVFFIPFSTGTNHFFLNELMSATRHPRRWIQLEPLKKNTCEILLVQEMLSKSIKVG